MHYLHLLIQFISCFVPNVTQKLQQITLLHYTSRFIFFTWEEAQCTRINIEMNLWHIREAISELFSLQLTPIHIHFTKEVFFMSQSSWHCIQKCCFPRSFQTKEINCDEITFMVSRASSLTGMETDKKKKGGVILNNTKILGPENAAS